MAYTWSLLGIVLTFATALRAVSVPTVTLNSGYEMPLFGLGTYTLTGEEGEAAIKYAIDVGYRHLDTATFYKNEREVGNAIRAKIEDRTVTRKELFVTTKLNVEYHREDDVLRSCKESRERLGLEYIDLFLIHSPISYQFLNSTSYVSTDIDYVETWRGMEKCRNAGIVRSIGISNFNSEQITRLLRYATIPPANHQFEVTLNLNQRKLIGFCQQHGISVSGYMPLGSPTRYSNVDNLWDHPVVAGLARKYGKTSAHIALRFVYQMGTAPLPKSATPSRIKSNIEIFDFILSQEEMRSLMKLETGARLVKFLPLANAKYYPFHIEY